MYLLAANDALECFIQFAMVAFFLLMSFGGWVIKKMAAAAQKRAVQRRLSEQELRPWQTVASQTATSQVSRPQRPAGNPYESYLRGEVDSSEVMVAEVVEPTAEHHLMTTLSSEHLSEHAAQLGHIDANTGGSIHDHFDYEVGQLGDSSDAIHENPKADKLPAIAVTTSEIAAIFRSPERIREALILNEILTRPDAD